MIRTLTVEDFDALHQAFVASFSDYVVPMAPSRDQLREMLTRRGWVPEVSVAAIENDAIVAFTVNCVDGNRAYDTGTGVVPSHRRLGLARQLMDQSCELLRARGCTTYVLEVLEANEKAAELYRDCGFIETRRLQCWTFDGPGEDLPDELTTRASHGDDAWWTCEPSWQNSSHSVARATETPVILGTDDAYAIVFPSNGDVPQLAVRPGSRRRGLGRRLLSAASTVARKPLRIINVDDADPGVAAFLESCGARRTVGQREMMKSL